MKTAVARLWQAINAASLTQWTVVVGGGLVVSFIAWILRLPLAGQFSLTVGLFLLGAGAILMLLDRRGVKELVEAELSLAREEVVHAKILRGENRVDAALVDCLWPDWRAKTATYMGVALGRFAQAKFEPDADMDADVALLDVLAANLEPEKVDTGRNVLIAAARTRRENEAASLFSYSSAPQ